MIVEELPDTPCIALVIEGSAQLLMRLRDVVTGADVGVVAPSEAVQCRGCRAFLGVRTIGASDGAGAGLGSRSVGGMLLTRR
jgi:hypothetical protein